MEPETNSTVHSHQNDVPLITTESAPHADPGSDASTSGTTAACAVHDEDYYFDFIVFQVGDRLFKVPRHKFVEESVIFRSMFDLPLGENRADGLTDKQPLRLDGVEQADFRHFLKYLYPRGIDRPVSLTLDEWLAVLKLSSLWEMDRIRNDAITNLPALLTNPAQKLGVAIDYNIEFWLVPAMQEIIQREAPLSVADLEHIGIECALRLAAIREACLPNNYRHSYTFGRSGIAPESRRGAVTYDCQERIEHDFKGFITIPPLKYDKALTADELVDPDPSPAEAPPQNVPLRMPRPFDPIPFAAMLYTVDNDSSSPSKPSKPLRNNAFYLDTITFQVEDELFKIPIRFISSFKTEPFQTLATRSLPSSDDSTEGMSDENPIILPDTSKVDFQHLLQVICPLSFEPEPITSVDVWISVLKLSTKWGLLRVRTLAIKTMNTFGLSNGDLIRFGREHKVSDWLVRGYFGFATQDGPLSLADVKDVIRGLEIDEGLDQIVKLAGLREKDRSGGSWSFVDTTPRPPTPKPMLDEPFSRIKPTVRMKPKATKSPISSPPRSPSPPPLRIGSSRAPQATDIGGLNMGSIRTMFKSEVDEVVMFEKYLSHLFEPVHYLLKPSDMTHMVDNNEPLSAPVEPLKPIRNSKFYMDCITLQVENELFKIPLRCISFNTEPFRTLASRSLPSGDSPVEGESDEDPIVLPDTSKVDFERLLEVICDLDLKRQKIKSKHVWISALKLSTKWRLLDVRRMAIEVLSEMKFTPGQFIQYGRDYKVAQWLVQGYHGFARQESPLGPLESQEVTYGLSAAEGLDCILKLAALRENGLTRTPRPSSTPSGKSSAAQPSEVTVKTITVKMETIRAVFKHEVDELSTFEKYFYLEI
ncbi:hypothetical protein EYR40_007124 [Pleurotus pulmonarius]|nr:hypothetical protein EYR40_007124 [Pleurotus pulmonarius]